MSLTKKSGSTGWVYHFFNFYQKIQSASFQHLWPPQVASECFRWAINAVSLKNAIHNHLRILRRSRADQQRSLDKLYFSHGYQTCLNESISHGCRVEVITATFKITLTKFWIIHITIGPKPIGFNRLHLAEALIISLPRKHRLYPLYYCCRISCHFSCLV